MMLVSMSVTTTRTLSLVLIIQIIKFDKGLDGAVSMTMNSTDEDYCQGHGQTLLVVNDNQVDTGRYQCATDV